jgi:FkbM family methyltransferase
MRSILRLRQFEIRNNRGEAVEGKLLPLTLRSPRRPSIALREVGSDILTFNEVIKDQVYKDVLALVPNCEAIIDLGANIGLTSLYFAAHYAGCRIFAIEPNPSTYEVLISNLGWLIDDGRCKTLNAAVWGKNATLGPASSVESEHYSAFATEEISTESNNSGMTFPGFPMSKILLDSGFQKVDLLKVDIEGAEVELFKDEIDWLDRVQAIAIEFHNESRRQSNFDQVMAQCGFKVIDHRGHTVIALKAE